MSMHMCSKKKKDHEQQGGGSTTTTTMPMTTAMRKGAWTEEEDAQLVRFVRLFGERRWDFLAKVSGLRRTGKSCRLRWVNYLHPGLRRGSITADEERLILQLHAQWGSRWSRIASSLPGRTDNEIKNFWRTRTRKLALEERRQSSNKTAAAAASPSSSLTPDCPGSPNSGTATTSSSAASESTLRGGIGDDEAEPEEASTTTAASQHQEQPQHQEECYTMDQLWNEIAASEAAASYVVDSWGASYGAAAEPPSPVWEFCSDYSLWRIDDEEYYKKMLHAS